MTDKQLKKLKEIIAKHFNAFLLSTIGAEALSSEDLRLLQKYGLLDHIFRSNIFLDAFRAGKRRARPVQELKDEAIRSFRTDNYDQYLNAVDKQALDQIKNSTEHYTKKLSDGIQNKMLEKVLEATREAVRSNAASPIGADPYERITIPATDRKILAKQLEEQTKDSFRDWERVVTTELNAAYSQGAVHAILEDNLHRKPEEIYVYMQGPLDAGTCKWCKKFYHDGNSFKIYRLTELLANGTNVGRKASDWKAVVPPMHPRCRHRIVELPKGYALNEFGQQIFISREHDELDNPFKKSLKGKVPTYSGWKLQDRYSFQGMRISIERKAGSYRSWTNRDGKKGKTLMHNDYGYIRNTLGPDGDHVDCYIGPNKEAPYVYIVHQHVPPKWKFDEEKVMMGFDSVEEAKKAYLKHYDNPKFFGGVKVMHIEEFKRKALGKKTGIFKSGQHKYIKRTGGPGNYKYWYKMPNGAIVSSDDPTHDSAANVHEAETSHPKELKQVMVNGKESPNKYYESTTGEKVFVTPQNQEFVIDHSSGDKVELGPHEPSGAKKIIVKKPTMIGQEVKVQPFKPIKPDRETHRKNQEASKRALSNEMVNAIDVWTSGAGGKGVDSNAPHAWGDEDDSPHANHYIMRDLQRGKADGHNILAVKAAKQALKALDKEFDKLPIYEGTVFRGVDSLQIPPKEKKKFFDSLQEGKTYKLDAYSSFTSDERTADEFGDIKFIVPNNTIARDISHVDESGYTNEAEVLAPKGVQYKISKVERNALGTPKKVWLEEITKVKKSMDEGNDLFNNIFDGPVSKPKVKSDYTLLGQVLDRLKVNLSALNKSVGQGIRQNHKYVKRTGGPGQYKYWYEMPDGSLQAGNKAPDGHPDNEIEGAIEQTQKKVVVVSKPKESGLPKNWVPSTKVANTMNHPQFGSITIKQNPDGTFSGVHNGIPMKNHADNVSKFADKDEFFTFLRSYTKDLAGAQLSDYQKRRVIVKTKP